MSIVAELYISPRETIFNAETEPRSTASVVSRPINQEYRALYGTTESCDLANTSSVKNTCSLGGDDHCESDKGVISSTIGYLPEIFSVILGHKLPFGYSDIEHSVREYLQLSAAITDPLYPPSIRRLSQERSLNSDTAEEFNGLDSEAEELGYKPCAELARDNAWRMLKAMNNRLPAYYSVSPTPEGSIGIEFRTDDAGLLVLCKADGGGTCIMSRKGGDDSMFKLASISSDDSFVEFSEFLIAQLNKLQR